MHHGEVFGKQRIWIQLFRPSGMVLTLWNYQGLNICLHHSFFSTSSRIFVKSRKLGTTALRSVSKRGTWAAQRAHNNNARCRAHGEPSITLTLQKPGRKSPHDCEPGYGHFPQTLIATCNLRNLAIAHAYSTNHSKRRKRYMTRAPAVISPLSACIKDFASNFP